jgi:transcription elongation factor Elf1
VRTIRKWFACLFGNHQDVVIDADMAGVAYYCMDCNEWLNPNVKWDATETYEEAMRREEK